MFCPLEQVEIRVDACPIRRCIYRNPVGGCTHSTLAEEHVEAKVLASLKSVKVYAVRAQIQEAKDQIMMGVILLRYSEFVKDSWPDLGYTDSNTSEGADDEEATETVNTQGPEENKATGYSKGDATPIADVLTSVFQLTPLQQEKFLSRARLSDWITRQNLSLDLNKVRETLRSISPQTLKEVNSK